MDSRQQDLTRMREDLEIQKKNYFSEIKDLKEDYKEDLHQSSIKHLESIQSLKEEYEKNFQKKAAEDRKLADDEKKKGSLEAEQKRVRKQLDDERLKNDQQALVANDANNRKIARFKKSTDYLEERSNRCGG